MSGVLRATADLAYRFGLGPRPSDVPDHRLVDVVEGPRHLSPGRALDLGCGLGRNTLYLARHGWEATGVEMSAQAVRMARRTAAAAGLAVRFLEGDVTRLSQLDVGDGYRLLVDGGCYHMVPATHRGAYAANVGQVAAPGALLIIVGFTGTRSLGLSEQELRVRFPAWEIFAAEEVPGDEMREYVSGPAPLRALLRRGWFRPMRFQLRRLPS